MEVLKEFSGLLNYKIVHFNAVDDNQKPIYHTNVLMSVGTSIAVVCFDCIPDPIEKKTLRDSLLKTHVIIEISIPQMYGFCGNVLELVNLEGKKIMFMSRTAFGSFDEIQKKVMLEHVDQIIDVPIPTIETIGGGSIRCMIAEIF